MTDELEGEWHTFAMIRLQYEMLVWAHARDRFVGGNPLVMNCLTAVTSRSSVSQLRTI